MQYTCRWLLMPLVLFILLSTAQAAGAFTHLKDTFSIEGRWDMTLYASGKTYPSWLEVEHSGFHTLVGRFVGIAGSARPIAKINYSNQKISFSIPPQWEAGADNLSVEGRVQGDSLAGTLTAPDGKTYSWTAVRAPFLKTAKEPRWGKPIRLFNGRDLQGWRATGANQWLVQNGVLQSPHSGANLVSDASFQDFKLHIEFRYPQGSNSGVYLRGRYEVQITDSKANATSVSDCGAIYGFLPPSEQVAKAAGEWQSYDITLVGRMVTVVANGVTIICHAEIPGITGGALNSREGEPGPFLLQGDHGPIEYRNIILTPAEK